MSLIIKLLRIDKPVGYALVLAPALYGFALSQKFYNDHNIFAQIKLLLLFTLGAIVTRSAGCIINDIVDRDFDKFVERTKERPITSGQISVREALVWVIILAGVALWILLQLTSTAIFIGIIAAIMTVIYPFLKRYTNLPQVFLGLVFNLGSLIAYSTITNQITVPAILLYIACGFWTLGYDTIYAFVDLQDDKKIGIKSTAVLIENQPYRLWLGLFYSLFLGLFWLAFYISAINVNYLILLVMSLMLFGQLFILDINRPKTCTKCFYANAFIGVLGSFISLG